MELWDKLLVVPLLVVQEPHLEGPAHTPAFILERFQSPFFPKLSKKDVRFHLFVLLSWPGEIS